MLCVRQTSHTQTSPLNARLRSDIALFSPKRFSDAYPMNSKQRYENDLKEQMEAKKRLDDDRRRREREEEDRLERRVREQQEKMKAEYEEEQNKKRQKEEAVSAWSKCIT